MPDLDDQGQAREREGERRPDAPADGFVEDEPSPERDEDRRDVLNQQRDPDVEPVDREEVRPLDNGEADAERRSAAAARRCESEAIAAASPLRSMQSPISAPAHRTAVSWPELMPEPRITFETVPLTAKSVAAIATIA